MNKKNGILALFFTSLLLLIVSGYFWTTKVYMAPEKVFWRTIKNNLQTTSFTREVRQGSGGGEVVQTTYVQFSPESFMNGFVSIKQNDNIVETELYGTQTTNFVRYTIVKPAGATEEQLESLEAITNEWAKQSVSDESSFLRESVYSLIPFTNLTSKDRKSVLSDIQNNKIYKIKKLALKQVGGRKIYVFTLDVDMSKYIPIYQDIALKSGIGKLALLESTEKDAGITEVVLEVDALSSTVLSIYTTDQERTETISARNQVRTNTVPTTTMTVEDLQEKLQLL